MVTELRVQSGSRLSQGAGVAEYLLYAPGSLLGCENAAIIRAEGTLVLRRRSARGDEGMLGHRHVNELLY